MMMIAKADSAQKATLKKQIKLKSKFDKRKSKTPSTEQYSAASNTGVFDNIKEESKMIEVLPARVHDKMSKALRPNMKSHPYTLDDSDL